SLGGEQRLPRRARRVRAPALRPVAGRRAGGGDRAPRPPLVPRLPVPPGAQVAADPPAPAVHGVRRGVAPARGGARRARGAPRAVRRGQPLSVPPFGFGRTPFLIAGPCVVEAGDVLPRVAEALAGVARRLDLPVCFKASFDKANRSRLAGERGP